jgi:hypothetical protein
MDPAPRPFAELPQDAQLGTPVPFACGTEEPASAVKLDHQRVTQCALSRVCGVCGAGLGRPLALVGSDLEAGRNAFHFPPAHLACAEQLLAAYVGVGVGVLGQESAVDSWVLVTTAGFEFVRPSRDQVDRRPTFEPNSLLDERRVS